MHLAFQILYAAEFLRGKNQEALRSWRSVDDADESGEEGDCARASSLRQPGEQDEVGVKADALQARAGF